MRIFFNSPGRRKCIFLFFLSILFLPAVFLASQTPAKSEKVGDEKCAECHDETAAKFMRNLHAKNEAVKGYVCESCHGPCKKHADETDPALAYHPRKDFLRTGENPCIKCHESNMFNSADGTSHAEAANGCCDCHQMHTNKTKLLKTNVKDLCLECHQDVYAKFRLMSHHPVNEGLMTCRSCHQVHGGDVDHVAGGRKNELCLSCHTRQQGPFIYEHQPVNEDCGICHDPHGTVANNLLVQNEPALCMGCHPMHFHTGLTAYNGEFTTPLDPSRGGISTRDGIKAAMLTKCTQCHRTIHGSDQASQSIGSQGKSLIR